MTAMNERSSAVWRIGTWQVNPELGEISRGDQRKKLDPRAMRILVFLAERPAQVVGVRELLEGVWGTAVVTPHSVYEAIAALRQALEDPVDAPQYITNLPRRGYRLIAPAEIVSPTEAVAPVESKSSVIPATDLPAETVVVARSGGRWKVVAGGILALAFIGAAVWVGRGALAPFEPVKVQKSIAVLPFVDLSETHDQEYFADGLAEELLEVLTTVPGLRVIGRTSSFQFKNKNEDVRNIGSALGASCRRRQRTSFRKTCAGSRPVDSNDRRRSPMG
jgi:DNA-binding winged helix-turn-helix (wHTH) protein